MKTILAVLITQLPLLAYCAADVEDSFNAFTSLMSNNRAEESLPTLRKLTGLFPYCSNRELADKEKKLSELVKTTESAQIQPYLRIALGHIYLIYAKRSTDATRQNAYRQATYKLTNATHASDPRIPDLHYLQGLAHRQKNFNMPALFCLNRAIELDPSFTIAYKLRADILMDLDAEHAAERNMAVYLRRLNSLTKPIKTPPDLDR